jgi:hypothetical protein
VLETELAFDDEVGQVVRHGPRPAGWLQRQGHAIGPKDRHAVGRARESSERDFHEALSQPPNGSALSCERR